MKTHNYRVRQGFTLIEMMTVVFIMVILAALGVGGMGLVKQRENKAKAQVDIALLAAGIQSYHSDMGQYPGLDENTDEKGDVSEELYDALFYQGYLSQSSGSSGSDVTEIYVPQLDPRSSKQSWVEREKSDIPSADLKITDPWKKEYLYRKGNFAQNPDFDLWSRGKDGESDFTNPDMRLEINADDIRNF